MPGTLEPPLPRTQRSHRGSCAPARDWPHRPILPTAPATSFRPPRPHWLSFGSIPVARTGSVSAPALWHVLAQFQPQPRGAAVPGLGVVAGPCLCQGGTTGAMPGPWHSPTHGSASPWPCTGGTLLLAVPTVPPAVLCPSFPCPVEPPCQRDPPTPLMLCRTSVCPVGAPG